MMIILAKKFHWLNHLNRISISVGNIFKKHSYINNSNFLIKKIILSERMIIFRIFMKELKFST